MKLIRYGIKGDEKPGIVIGDKMFGLIGFDQDYDEIFFNTNGLGRLKEYVEGRGDDLLPLEPGVRLGPPVARPSKIICIGMNYASHARESGAPVPSEPIVFLKSTTALNGPNDDVIIPRGSKKTDWEVELAVVIQKKASYVELHEAPDYIAGYCLHNDYSERAYQLEKGGQWVKGKSFDSFAPMGPFLVTPEEAGDVGKLDLWLMVNGRQMQAGNTSDLIFSVPFLIHYISQFMTLLPGDIISTGTPSGVGLGIKPLPQYLQAGDIVSCGIENLGSSTQLLRPFPRDV
jgi:2-keto-4-pentenoate hydratase/2-oxohepta-3-ene-1,7-dioic acid hydratase in catechol pathway